MIRKGSFSRALVAINVLLLLAMAVHDLDHFRQAANAHYSIPAYLFLVSIIAYIPIVVALALCWQLARLAAIVTIAGAILVAVSFSDVHLIGGGSFWGLWATPYREMRADALSWLLLAIPLLTALAAVYIAARQLWPGTPRRVG